MFRCAALVSLFCAITITSAVAQTSSAALPLSSVQLPPGFQIGLYTQQPVTDARQLALSRGFNQAAPDAVIVYVGSTGSTVGQLSCYQTRVACVQVVCVRTAPVGARQ